MKLINAPKIKNENVRESVNVEAYSLSCSVYTDEYLFDVRSVNVTFLPVNSSQSLSHLNIYTISCDDCGTLLQSI